MAGIQAISFIHNRTFSYNHKSIFMTIHNLERNIGEKLVITTAAGKHVVVEVLGNNRFGILAPDDINIRNQEASYSIDLNVALQIVNVTYWGAVSLKDRMSAVNEVCENYAQSDPLKILVDVNKLEMDLTAEEQIAFGEYLAGHAGLTDARVAVLHKSEHNPNLLVDITAFNNGYLLAEFNKRINAESWLMRIAA